MDSPVFSGYHNVPNAPERNSHPKILPMSFWEYLLKRGNIREKYAFYTPEDIEEIDCKKTLKWLYEKYNPSSQPRNVDEELYFYIMSSAIAAKLL